MQLAKLNETVLHDSFIRIVGSERKVTAEVIDYIREVDRRKSYLNYQCSSLYEYLTKVAGYSEGAANRRISAARLMHSVPEIKEDLASGSLNLSQAAAVAQGLRQKKKSGKVSAGETKDLLDLLKNQNGKKTQVIISRELDIPVVAHEKQCVQKDESVRYEVTLTKEENEELQRVKELLSHVHPGGKLKDLLNYLTQDYLKRKDPLRKKVKPQQQAKSEETSTTTATTAAKPAPARPSASTIRAVFKRDQCCQWKDPRTGAVCGSKFQGQADHIQPLWAGGGHEPENLQILCGVHNRLRYQQQTGARAWCDS